MKPATSSTCAWLVRAKMQRLAATTPKRTLASTRQRRGEGIYFVRSKQPKESKNDVKRKKKLPSSVVCTLYAALQGANTNPAAKRTIPTQISDALFTRPALCVSARCRFDHHEVSLLSIDFFLFFRVRVDRVRWLKCSTPTV